MTRILALVLLILMPSLAAAETAATDASFQLATPTTDAADCETLAEAAGAREGLPPGLMAAISRMESGRHVSGQGTHAWPWTLDEAGKGSFYDTKAEAMAHLNDVIASGATNVDIGCMQLNYKWHSAGFPSLEVMMDPTANTTYAAHFLRQMADRFGSYEKATEVYHSFNPSLGVPYEQQVARILANLGEIGGSGAPPALVADALTATAPDAGLLQGILLVAASPLFATTAGQTPLQSSPTDPGTPENGAAQIALNLPRFNPEADVAPVPDLASDMPEAIAANQDDIQALRQILAENALPRPAR